MNKLFEVYVVFSFDSHYKSTKLLSSYYKLKGHRIVYIQLMNNRNEKIVDKQVNIQNLSIGNIEKIVNQKSLVIASLGGKDFNLLINILSDKYCYIMSMYPGIVPEINIDDFLSKARANLVLLNSKKDKAIYDRYTSSIGLESNGELFGCSWYLPKDYSNKKSNITQILFIEQSIFPKTDIERKRLVDLLVNISLKNEHTKIVIKARIDGVNLSPNDEALSLKSILSEKKINTNNISFTNDDIGDAIKKSDIIVSISSSALIESLLAGKCTYVVGDFGINNYLVDFYANSGIIMNIADFNVGRDVKCKSKWLEENVENPSFNLDKIYQKTLLEINSRKSCTAVKICGKNVLFKYIVFLINNTFLIKNNSFKSIFKKFSNGIKTICKYKLDLKEKK